MRVRKTFAALTILLSGCTSPPLQIATSVELVGEISNPAFTGWYTNYCNGGSLTKASPNCAQVGGEIYKAVLLGVQTPGSSSPQNFVIAFPGHALSREYRARVHVYLVRAPDNFTHETGIAYLVREWSDS